MKSLKKLFLIIAVLLMPITISAKGIAEAGDNITLEGEYDSNKIVAGDVVTNKASIDGLTFLFGNVVKESGNTEYDFLFGNEITVEGNINKDLFIAGNIVKVSKDAILNRDLYIACDKATIEATNIRNVYFAGESIDVRGITINGNLYFAGTEIFMDDDTVINGTLKYNDDAEVKGMKEENIHDVSTYHVDKYERSVKDEISSQILSAVGLTVTMIVLFLVFKKLRTNVNEMEVSVPEFAKSLVTGFVALIAIPLVSIMAMLTIVLLPVSIISIVLYCIFLYLSEGFAGYMLGKALLGKLIDEKAGFVAYIFVGVVLIKVLSLIPVISGIVGIFSLFYGLGVIINLINKMRK